MPYIWERAGGVTLTDTVFQGNEECDAEYKER